MLEVRISGRNNLNMPIYRYKCSNCTLEAEVILSIKEKQKYDISAMQCSSCGKKELKFTLGLSSFKLTGKGWYKDGYT